MALKERIREKGSPLPNWKKQSNTTEYHNPAYYDNGGGPKKGNLVTSHEGGKKRNYARDDNDQLHKPVAPLKDTHRGSVSAASAVYDSITSNKPKGKKNNG